MDQQADFQPTEPESAAQPTPQIDQFELENFLRTVKAEQNLAFGFFGGLVGMFVGAFLWTLITVITDFQIGFMAIGVGFLVGVSVRYAGRGMETIFGVVAGFLSLVGCLVGNLFSVLVVASREFGIPFFEMLLNLDMAIIVELMTITFSPIDLLFYGLAIYTGYRAAFRKITEEELARFVRPAA